MNANRTRYPVPEKAGSISQADWNKGFAALEQISEKFDGWTDDDLDALFGEVLAEVHKTGA